MKIITNYSSYILAFLLLSIFTQSCREEPVEIPALNRDKVMSYSDLFDAFWDEMNNNYNYFFEEDYDWDDIYEIYSPRFKKLRTFNDPNADSEVAEREIQLAFKYFADIISKFTDVHLNITIGIPSVTNKHKYKTNNFSGGMSYKYSVEDGFEVIYDDSVNPRVSGSTVIKIMEDKLKEGTVFKKEKVLFGDYSGLNFLSGCLESDPSLMYIKFDGFEITPLNDPVDKFPVLHRPYKKDLPKSFFESFAKLEITDPDAKGFKQRMKNNIKDLYDSLLLILESDEYKEYLAAREHFFQTEDISKLDAIKDKFENFVTPKVQANINIGKKEGIKKDIDKYKKEANPSQSKLLYSAYNQYNNIRTYLLHDCNLGNLVKGEELNLGSIVKKSCDTHSGMYNNLFNPLAKGKVKKLIIDLRGNGGGLIMDANYFVSRFITNKFVFGYYRTKEGDGRFNYGPWLPEEIEPHKFHIPKSIPIVILLDRGSASMSEISSMILKSQGDHIKIIGDNSAGATAALTDQDEFNGGSWSRGTYFNFYMPMMAFKTLDGKVIEGEGITPDIKVIPTKEEVEKMETTKYDPALEKALEEIRKMTVK